LYIEGAYYRKLVSHDDNRGYLMEVFRDFQNKQVNVSHSLPNTIRGIHAAYYGKLVTCISGTLTDYVIDLRPNSPTFLGWARVHMEPNDQIYIPACCGHAFVSGSSNGCTIVYAQEDVYKPETNQYVAWNDSIINIPWHAHQTNDREFIISDTDKNAPLLSEITWMGIEFNKLNLNQSKRKILVVGASGQLGQAFVQLFNQKDTTRDEYLCIGTYCTNKLTGCSIHVDLENLFEKDAEFLLNAICPSVMFICAAFSSTDACEANKGRAYAINVESPIQLAKAARKVDCKIVYISSDYVFDGKSGPYSEHDKPNPINVYGKTKWEAEKSLLSEDIEKNTVIVIRTHGIYGPDANQKKFVYQVAQKKRISFPENQVGNPIDSRDLAQAVFKLSTHHAKPSGIFHIAGPIVYSRYSFALEILRLLKKDFMVRVSDQEQKSEQANAQNTANRPLYTVLTTQKFRDFIPEFHFRSLEESFSDWDPS